MKIGSDPADRLINAKMMSRKDGPTAGRLYLCAFIP
jgi:hypothetical protein